MKALWGLACVAFVASVLVHGATFVGVNPSSALPAAWALHLLVFVVWVPVVLLCHKAVKRKDRRRFWRVVTRHAPAWMKVLSVACLVYAGFNFFYTGLVLNEGGVPGVIEGQRVLHSHGDIIRTLTSAEYELHLAYMARMFSGHWMVFFAVAATVLTSRRREPPPPP